MKKKQYIIGIVAVAILGLGIWGISSIGGNGNEPQPTPSPTVTATVKPTATAKPTTKPTEKPTKEPVVTVEPTATTVPTPAPTQKPVVTAKPVVTVKPTVKPVVTPTPTPTVKPTPVPTAKPTIVPTVAPTPVPTVKPVVTPTPTFTPTPAPTLNPTIIPVPTIAPTINPSSYSIIFQRRIKNGCEYCKTNTCSAYDYVNGVYTHENCPHYSEKADSSKYCQTCGKPVGDGTNGTCWKPMLSDKTICYYCGETCYRGQCHTCHEHHE